MKCFGPLQSCIRPRDTLASPSHDDNHRTTPHSSAYSPTNSQPLIRSKSRWRPTLSIIREDRVGVAEDHGYSVYQKPDKKSSVAILPPSDYFTNKGKSKRVIIVAPFGFSIF